MRRGKVALLGALLIALGLWLLADSAKADDGTASANACDGEVAATGHILVGNPTNEFFFSTNVLQRNLLGTVLVDGIDSFFFDPPPSGTTICTRTTDGSGAGYDINVYFRHADWTFINYQGCATNRPDERCIVPTGAAHANADAAFGADLTVEIVRAV